MSLEITTLQCLLLNTDIKKIPHQNQHYNVSLVIVALQCLPGNSFKEMSPWQYLHCLPFSLPLHQRVLAVARRPNHHQCQGLGARPNKYPTAKLYYTIFTSTVSLTAKYYTIMKSIITK